MPVGDTDPVCQKAYITWVQEKTPTRHSDVAGFYNNLAR